jgi:Na+-translocating ferredoxin:NAD+ oxidoreductase RnfC subunit
MTCTLLHPPACPPAPSSFKARRILEEELRDERQGRSTAEEARAVAEAERSRLQRALDEATTQLRVVQHKAAEAEEDQLRAEEVRRGQQEGLVVGCVFVAGCTWLHCQHAIPTCCM